MTTESDDDGVFYRIAQATVRGEETTEWPSQLAISRYPCVECGQPAVSAAICAATFALGGEQTNDGVGEWSFMCAEHDLEAEPPSAHTPLVHPDMTPDEARETVRLIMHDHEARANAKDS